ncbi:unnamed protein product [Lactuca saligna]|uniref:Uncharacterized protein n=1 Tax=Lactuca saligna TaxID=75948 RepID=A0AA36EGJ3_LACSI|nr:unnamed protein product [Lactuca saligna]
MGLSKNEDIATTLQPENSQPISTNPEVTIHLPISVPISTDFIETVSIPYPTTNISIPISIASCPPVSLGVLQPTPIFTDSTTTPSTTIKRPVSVNASDAGARASGFTTGHSTPLISPLRQNDLDMIVGDDEDFARFTYSLFNIRTKSDDEAPITRGKINAIDEKLDSLLHVSKASSTDDYSQATIKSLLETLMKEHSTNLEKMNKVVDASAKANEVISSLGSTLKTEKEKLQEVCTGLKSDHDEFQSSISLQIYKLQDDLIMEREIMDALAVKTKKVKVLTVKLENVEKQVNDLLSEMETMKSYITDVIAMLSDIIETRDSMITITVKKQLAEKLRQEDPKPLANPIVKSESKLKGKEKLFNKEPIVDNSEDDEPDENELKRRKAHEAEMDEHQRIIREADVKDKVERESYSERICGYAKSNLARTSCVIQASKYTRFTVGSPINSKSLQVSFFCESSECPFH